MAKRLVMVALASWMLAGCGEAEQSMQSPLQNTLQSPNQESVKARNFHQVTDEIYRSGDLVEADMAEMKARGIETIVSLEDYGQAEANAEKRWANDAGLEFVWMPMSGFAKPTLAQIDSALEILTDEAQQPILVHCYRGADRTGIVVAAHRIRHQGWTVAYARQEMRDLGHLRALYWWDDVLDDVLKNNL